MSWPRHPLRPPPGPVTLLLTALAQGVSACSDAAGPEPNAGVDLAALFAPATEPEVAAVREEWATRIISVSGFRVEAAAPLAVGPAQGQLRIVSHLVDGQRHYGALAAGSGAASGSLPVLVYSHGGDHGVSSEELGLLFLALGDGADDYLWVVPSFRSEELRSPLGSYRSQGSPSPWDRDVDDALALLSAALAHEPAADPGRVAVVGFSRGAGVGLLMAARDPRIDAVVEFFGPTDFFDPWVRDIVEDALQGDLRDLPGLPWLDQTYIQPLKRGATSVAVVRKELVRRSAALFASTLPAVQVHHGTADSVVSVSQAQRLDQAMRRLDRAPPSYQLYTYPGGEHDPLTLSGSVGRVVAFLAQFVGSARAAPGPPGR
jgi:dipeptidyl aminopeptidase/acylaminoacyl peptidase